MKTAAALAAALAGLAPLARAHMEMMWPPPLRSGYNRFTTDQDYDMTSPLHADGRDFPCKGSLRLLGTPQAQAVAEWTAGETYNVTITGNTPHSGGSCQVSVSTDAGATWRVLHSYVGKCPLMGRSSYPFQLPADTPEGEALVAWSWFNNVGNREMYMNCAVVAVKAPYAWGAKVRFSGGARRVGAGAGDPLDGRPLMFEANMGNGCHTKEGFDVLFPHPGAEVDMKSTHTHPPVGKCAP